MSKRNLILIALALVILAIVVRYVTKPSNNTVDNRIGTPLLDSGLVETFDEIVIESHKKTIHLRKENGLWSIPEKSDFPVDMKQLLELTDKLTSYKLASLITKDPERLGHFKVRYKTENSGSADQTGTQVTFKQKGKEIYKLIIGKRRTAVSTSSQTPSYGDGVYVRVGDASSVYLIKENLNLDTDPDSWIKKSLFDLDKIAIQSVVFENPDSRFELKRDNPEEKLQIADLKENEKTQEYPRDSVLGNLENFSIDQIALKSALPERQLGLKSVIHVRLFDKSSLTFQILSKVEIDPLKKDKDEDKRTETFYASIVPPSTPVENDRWKSLNALGAKWFFKLDEYKAKQWIKKREDFVKMTPKK